MKYLLFLLLGLFLIPLFFGCSEARARCVNPMKVYAEVVKELPTGFINIYSPYKCIKAPDITTEAEFRVVHSFEVNLKQGEFIKATGIIGLTNPMPKPMGVWKYWVLSDNPLGIAGVKGSRDIGRNITPGMHHDALIDVGHWKIQQSGKFYLNFVVYAASGEKRLHNEYIVIDSGYSNFLIERL